MMDGQTGRRTDRWMVKVIAIGLHLFYAFCLMLLYICIMFHENISKGFRAIEGLLF